ncbi:hypothetical protein DOTSEDRAFT_153620 [Dothistroma septosporum NZE10]|uniref:Uncharacterized protein n=1 Tax=Dothistroma septosporum (strain NZE10 / CBS 128990) TaxID=675120 RepID=M2YMK9_DOTSN|nr:hypothetical protein DOTSEDRAFT_153620 [Dothistroma septosporum NZE10]
MIKNHYQRQIDGGRADLGDSAFKADARRERGEDIGPPPTPTPIVKRKYENPQSGGTPRALAPQTDAMDIDEPLQGSQSSIAKHASPPGSQFQTNPRFTTSAQSTPIPAHRAVPSPLPTESSQGSASSMQQGPKHEWPARVLGPSGHSGTPHPTPLDREPRPPFYQPHRNSMLSHFGPSRANPSPPPNSQHSRTSSLSGQQQGLPPREQRSGLGGPPPGAPHQSSQSLQSNPYAAQQQFPPFSQAPAQAQTRAHHSHNNSVTEIGSGLQRVHGSGREEMFRREEDARIRRERDEEQMRYEAISRERSQQQQHEAQRRDAINNQRYQEQEMERHRQQQQHQAYSRGPMSTQPLGQPSYSSPFGGPRMGHGGIREQSQREVDMAEAQQRRMIEDHDRRRQQEHSQMPPQPFMDRREPSTDPYGRRPEEPMFPSRRNTPYGGPYSQPPPPRR